MDPQSHRCRQPFTASTLERREKTEGLMKMEMLEGKMTVEKAL